MACSSFARVGACLPILLAASMARADNAAADCDAAKKGSPVELSYHVANGVKGVLQLSHGPADDAVVVWRRMDVADFTFVVKSSYVAGIAVESQETTTFTGKLKSKTTKYSVEGFPKNFDRRSDIQFKATSAITFADGTTEESVTPTTYRFKSENTMTIGSCTLNVVHGEFEVVNPKTDKPFRTPLLYFPELKLSAVGMAESEPIIDTLSTTFTPITPIP